MEVLNKGTIEPIVVVLRDRLGNVVDLSTDVTNVLYSTHEKVAKTAVQTDQPATFDGDYPMYALCEIDTTLAGYVVGEEYLLYLKYTAGSETPRIGPVPFRVEAD